MMLRMVAVATMLCAGLNMGIGGEVADAATAIHPILIGSDLPDIELKGIGDKPVELRKLTKGKPTVIVYYRGGWCPFCTQQITALGKKRGQLQKLGFQLIAVSADKPSLIEQFKKEMGLGFQLYSDNTMAGATALGIAYRLPQETVKLYKERFRLDLNSRSGMKHHILPVPAVFVLDRQGVITFEYVNPNYKVRLDEDVLMAAAQAALRN